MLYSQTRTEERKKTDEKNEILNEKGKEKGSKGDTNWIEKRNRWKKISNSVRKLGKEKGIILIHRMINELSYCSKAFSYLFWYLSVFVLPLNYLLNFHYYFVNLEL